MGRSIKTYMKPKKGLIMLKTPAKLIFGIAALTAATLFGTSTSRAFGDGAFIVCGCILTRGPTKKPPRETLRPAVPDEHQPSCFALEEERGANWKGSGGAVPSIKETRPSL